MKNAEKYLKTSPLKLKFTPEWDPAGDEFSRAATAYKVVLIKMILMIWKEVKGVKEEFVKCLAND